MENINLTPLLKSIFDYDPDGPNIHHLMAVHGYSRLIAQMENVDGHTLFITEVAAYVLYRERYGRLLQARVSSGDERKCVQDRKRKISSGADV